ncbi:hypothetical protein ACLB2K_030303 [Fragaria x ananassa]
MVFLGCIHHTPINITLPLSFSRSPLSLHYHLHLLTNLGIGGSKAGAPGLPSDAILLLIDRLWKLGDNPLHLGDLSLSGITPEHSLSSGSLPNRRLPSGVLFLDLNPPASIQGQGLRVGFLRMASTKELSKLSKSQIRSSSFTIANRNCLWREVKRFVDLTVDETSDLWLTAQKVGSRLESYHKATSLTLTIQDGPQAGQTVPHVHIHILPRKGGDFENNDDIYDALDEKEKELKQKLDLDKERKDRSLEEMAQEAEEYRKLFL